jgi:alkylation response protein AidB-like acyl-CoA dehydrogenase
MRFDLNDSQAALVAELDRLIDESGADLGPLDQLALLGAHRLLAVHYPVRYGGRGLSLADHAAVCERMGEYGLPDVAHLITVQAVGCTVLSHGTEQQRRTWLPQIAAGRLLASLLLSERVAGSDLAGIETTAVPDGAGWRITGVKNWSLFTEWSTVALCSVRTRPREHRYDGLSLFLVDLSSPGVKVSTTFRATGTPYCTVTFDGVLVGEESLVGPLHRGWPILPTAIGFERMGFDYLTRAVRWLAAVEQEVRRLPADLRSGFASQVARLRFSVANARAMAYHAVATADGLDMDDIAIAYAKLACGTAAQAVAQWAGTELLPVIRLDGGATEVLRAAVAEAPEFTISGGAQELQLDLIANEFPIGGTFR